MRRLVALVGMTLVAAALVLAGCGSDAPSPTPSVAAPTPTASPSPSPTTTPPLTPTPSPVDGVPVGWLRVDVPQAGFSIALPPGWAELGPDVLEDDAAFDELIAANPAAADALTGARDALERGELAFFAFDASAEAAFAPNLNVIEAGLTDAGAAEAAARAAAEVEAAIPVSGPVRTETAGLPAGEAGIVRYRWEPTAADGTATTLEVVQYVILTPGGKVFVVSLSAAAGQAQALDAFGAIAASFRELAD